MARKSDNEDTRDYVHEFTKQIHSTRRTGTRFANMKNWNERQAKKEDSLACKHCRYFYSCSMYLGEWHKPCTDFEWD